MPRRASRGETNYYPFDRFSVLHAIGGAVMGLAGVRTDQALFIGAGWELVEPQLKEIDPKAFPNSTQDTLANALGDIACVMGGFLAGRLIRSGSSRRMLPKG
jgi:hypothetical protein